MQGLVGHIPCHCLKVACCCCLSPDPDYLARCEAAKTDPQKPAPEMIWTVSHQLACNLANPDAEVQKWDPADQYQYEVQPLHPDGTPADKPPSAVTPRQLS